MDDWYNITEKEIIENGGSGLLNKYGRFTFKINNVYLFIIMNGNNLISIQQQGYWNNKENQRNFLD